MRGKKYATEEERREARRNTLRKYRVSEKNKANQRRYQASHRTELSAKALVWTRKNRDRINALVRIRLSTPRGKALQKAKYERYVKRNRHKRLAKDAVHNAVRAGKLFKTPCVVCGEQNVEGHHPDYTKPLDVVWLCKKHHKDTHYGR